jgi:hypothetical protein
MSTSVFTSASAFEAVCGGFGCGAYGGLLDEGQEAVAGEPSITFEAFLKAVEEKRVKKVGSTTCTRACSPCPVWSTA